MIETKLLDYKILKLVYENNITKDEDIKINTTTNSNVNYNEAEKKCICTYSVKMVADSKNDPLKVEVVIAGIFDFDVEEDKRKIHIEVSKKLFPYLQSTTSSLMALVGIPNFILPENEIKLEDVTI